MSKGVRPSDRVVIRMSNVIEAVLMCLACLRIGAIAVPLSTRQKGAELSALLRRLKPSLYAGEEQQAEEVAAVPPSVLPPGARYFLGRQHTDDHGARWADFFVEVENDQLPRHLNKNAVAVLLTTSGTTAEPKFVAHTLSSLAHAVENYALCRADGDANPIMLTGTPLSHASGSLVILMALRFGRRVRLLPAFEAEDCLNAIAADCCSWFLGAPYMFAQLVAAQRARPRDLSSLRFCVAAGDVCPAELSSQVLEIFGVELRSLWGATEVMGSVLQGPAGSVGRRAPGAQMRLVDEQGAPVSLGDAGELQVRGPNLSIGYWLAPGEIDPARSDGWFATGDLMRQGPTDELWFVGRKKDLIVRGGINISPLEVEAVLLSHPWVVEAGVAGATDALWGEVVVAGVRLSHLAGANALEDVLRMTRDRLADYKVPERLKLVSELPRNSLGKIDRRALCRLLAH
jgi:acyl-CoA synthetase (AMP-forming)/AMP-acid ligase II